jgi:uncharacterized protein YjdB
MKKIVLVVLACCVWMVGNGQIITTFAGTGVAGNTGDGGSATAAQISNPNAIKIDVSGNVYISSSNVIRKISTLGIISTIAGTGVVGYSGDGGPATAATFNDITGFAIDASGNIFIADRFNNRIRKINTLGIISTYCGNGTSTSNGDGGFVGSATVNHPSDVAFDNLGNLYICDEQAYRIRKVNASGIISHFAGTTFTSGFSGDGGMATIAKFNWPTTITIDGNNNVYIADYLNSCIRKINTAGIITTVAGSGTIPGYFGDGGPATNARLSNIWGVTASADGTLYIGDNNYNNVIRKVNTSGIISTIAGTGAIGFSGDDGPATAATFNIADIVALDQHGNMYVCDHYNNRIRLVTFCPPPNADSITGISMLCAASTVSLTTNGDTGGRWSISNTSVATIDTATGVVSALSVGTASVYYTVTNSCGTAVDSFQVSVSAFADAGGISGPSSIHAGYSVSLTSTVGDGVWSVTNGNASIDPATGYLTGIAEGQDTIVYTTNNGCGIAADSLPITITPSLLPCYLPATGLVAWYPFTGNTNDSSGNGHNGVNSGATLTTDRFGNANSAYYFDGASSYLSVPYATAFNMTKSTWNIWYQLPQPNNNDGNGRFLWGSDFSTGSHISHVIFSDTPLVQIVGTSFREAKSHQSIVDDSWHMLTMTYDQVAGEMSIYSDGILKNTVSITTFSWSEHDLRFGVSMDPYWQKFYGALDDASLYSRVLSGDEIMRLYTGNPQPPSVSGLSQVCAGNSITLHADTTGGIWQTSNSSVATVDITGVVTGVTGGTALISYTLSGICGLVTDTATVVVNALPNPGTITGADTICAGSAALFTSTGSTGSWQTSNPLVATIDATGSLYAVSSGAVTISYTVSSATCGDSTVTLDAYINQAPDAIVVTPDTVTCVGHVLTLNAMPAGGEWTSFSPLTATVDHSGIVYGNMPGTTLLAYVVNNTCGSDTAYHYISVHAMPDATITSPATLCIADGTTTFTSVSMSGSDMWTASNDALLMAGSSAILMHAGVDTITHITYNDCGDADTATLVVTILGLPDAGTITGVDTIGVGVLATLSASVAGGIWETNAPAIGTISASGVVTTISPSDTLVIRYTVSNGCLSNSVSHVIVVLLCSENAGTIVGTDSVCAGALTTFSNPTATPGSWSSMFGLVSVNAATGVATAISAGADTIIYTVTSPCGVLTSKFPIIVNPSPGAGSITGLADVCSGSSITLTSTITGGNWTTDSTSVATVDSNGVVTGIAAGNAVITYSVTSFSCGTVQSVHVVTVNLLPALSPISGPPVVAALSSVTLADTAIGGLWTSSNTTIATIDAATGIATGIMPGSTVITYIKTNSAGCTSSVTHGLTVAGSLTSTSITPAAATLCHDIAVTMMANTVGGATDLVYQWYKNGVSIPGATNASYATSTSGFFHVVISNPAGSAVVAGVNVLPSPEAIVNITGSSTLYTGSFANYQWYKDHSPIPGAVASIYNATATGDYYVVVSDGHGCTDTSDNYHFVTTGITTAAGPGITVNIYPNPVNNTVNIDAPVIVSVKVLAADGKTILEAREAKSLDVSRLAEGLYMIMVYNQDGQLLKAQTIVKAD